MFDFLWFICIMIHGLIEQWKIMDTTSTILNGRSFIALTVNIPAWRVIIHGEEAKEGVFCYRVNIQSQFEFLLNLAVALTGQPKELIAGKSRKRIYHDPRACIQFLLCNDFGWSQDDVASLFMCKGHTAVTHNVRAVKNQLSLPDNNFVIHN